MTKKDKINCLLMAPLLLIVAGGVIYSLAMQPLVIAIMVMIVAFVIGFIRFMEN